MLIPHYINSGIYPVVPSIYPGTPNILEAGSYTPCARSVSGDDIDSLQLLGNGTANNVWESGSFVEDEVQELSRLQPDSPASSFCQCAQYRQRCPSVSVKLALRKRHQDQTPMHILHLHPHIPKHIFLEELEIYRRWNPIIWTCCISYGT